MSPNPSFYEIKVAPVAKLENGYTRIANELLEALVTSPFTPSQLRVILGIARFTYGYSKRTALIPTKKIADFCEIKPWLARYAVSELISAQVLFREGGQRGEIGINNHIDQWRFPQGQASASVGKSQHSDNSECSEIPTLSVGKSQHSCKKIPTLASRTPFSIKKNLKEEEKESEKSTSSSPENVVELAERIAAAWNLKRPDMPLSPAIPPKRLKRILETLAFAERNLGLDDRWPADRDDIPAWFGSLFRYAGNQQGYLQERDFGFFMDPDRLTDIVEEVYGPR